MVTANDIRDHAGSREIRFFISNDQCPPVAGLRVSPAGAESRRQRSAIRRCVAVCADSAATGDDGRLQADVRERWQLLSAG